MTSTLVATASWENTAGVWGAPVGLFVPSLAIGAQFIPLLAVAPTLANWGFASEQETEVVGFEHEIPKPTQTIITRRCPNVGSRRRIQTAIAVAGGIRNIYSAERLHRIIFARSDGVTTASIGGNGNFNAAS